MKVAKNLKSIIHLLAVVMTATLIAGCTLDGISDETVETEVTQADLVAASRILGESLSDENSGIMASLNDALTSVSSAGLEKTQASVTPENPSLQTHDDDSNTGRGEERNFSYTYNPETGTHTITFQRMVHDIDYFKSVNDTLKYIFTDNSGQFIRYPKQDKELIETIDFKGYREGQIETQIRESQFVRRDTFFIDGVSAASNILSIDGVHHGRGRLSTQDDAGNPLERNYTNKISFLEIQIDKAIVEENQSLEHGVTGALSWEMVIRKTTGGSTETKTVTGTIEMNGDGTALLRFEGFRKLFLINLDNGDVRDHDSEFQGQIKHVDIHANTFTLASGRTIQLSETADIHPESDVSSLEAVAHALESGSIVEAEGTGHVEGDRFIATKVLFEVREKDTRNFEGHVTGVSLDTGTFTLDHETVIRIGDLTVVSESGNLYSLQDVAGALEAGVEVIAYGSGKVDDSTTSNLVATEVVFKARAEQFEGHVTAVNLENNTFTLNQELVIRIGEETDIHESGDYLTLGAVAEALEQSQGVIGHGKGFYDPETSARIFAFEVRFDAQ